MKTPRIFWIFLVVGALGFAAEAANACVEWIARRPGTFVPVPHDDAPAAVR